MICMVGLLVWCRGSNFSACSDGHRHASLALMRATLMYGAGDVRIEHVPDAGIVEPTDALVRVTRACICGSDLWPYKTMEHSETGRRMGHEAIGVVEAAGGDVHTLKEGGLVVMPFAFSDGSCAFCREGLHTSCVHGGFFGTAEADGAQAEAVRVPQAGGNLFVLPVDQDHAPIPAPPTPPDRIALAREFGATDVVSERGNEAVERVHELTDGFGVHAVLECVGLEQSELTAIEITRPGGAVGRVGVPQDETMPASQPAFYNNISVSGGPAPVRAYIDELLPDILSSAIEPGRVFDRAIGLEEVPEGYRAMNDRESIKVMVTP